MTINSDTKFLIVGLGLIGGSYCLGLRKQGYRVSAIARRKETIDYALTHGIIDEGSNSADAGLLVRQILLFLDCIRIPFMNG